VEVTTALMKIHATQCALHDAPKGPQDAETLQLRETIVQQQCLSTATWTEGIAGDSALIETLMILSEGPGQKVHAPLVHRPGEVSLDSGAHRKGNRGR
jgi:hypothetical protein